MSKIGEKIKKYRKGHGWTQIEFARRLSLTQPTVSAVERGIDLPGALFLIRLERLGGDAPKASVLRPDLFPGIPKDLVNEQLQEHQNHR